MGKASYLHDFAESWLSEAGRLGSSTTSVGELAHHLLHLRVVSHARHTSHAFHHTCHLCHVRLASWTTSPRHASHTSGILALLLPWMLTRLSHLQRSLFTGVGKQLVGIQLQVVLHLTHHRSNLLTKRSRKELLRQIDNVRRNSFAKQNLSDLIRKVIAVVL